MELSRHYYIIRTQTPTEGKYFYMDIMQKDFTDKRGMAKRYPKLKQAQSQVKYLNAYLKDELDILEMHETYKNGLVTTECISIV